MNIISPCKKSPLKFFLLVYVFAIPFWLIGAVAEHFSIGFPMNLPISALMFVCPIIAALILVYRENKLDGIRGLFKKVFDYKKIKQRIWYMPSISIMPILMFLSYWVMRLMGYAINPMLDRWSALKSSIILGSVGALLHI